MKLVQTIGLACGAAVLTMGSAQALTVANQSGKAQTIVVDLGATEPEHKVDAGKSQKVDCPDGCEVRIKGLGYGWAAASGETLTIGEDGQIAYGGKK